MRPASRRRLIEDPIIGIARRAAEANLARTYADGFRDGLRVALCLAIGRTPPEGGGPYLGPVPPGLEDWSLAALAAIERDKKSAV